MLHTPPTPLTAKQQAVLNNLRTIVKRQSRPTSLIDPSTVTELLIQYGDLMRATGLAEELLTYLEHIQDRTPADTVLYPRLLVEIAQTLDAIGGMHLGVDATFQEAFTLFAMYSATEVHSYHAQAHLAYGRHLLNNSDFEAALAHFQQAMEMYGAMENVADIAAVEAELGRVYLAQGDFSAAVLHFERALEGFAAEGESAVFAYTSAQTELAMAYIQRGEIGQASQLLGDALTVCDALELRVLRAQVLREMAYVDQTRAETVTDEKMRRRYLDEAEQRLQQAVDDLLSHHDSLELAIAYHDLGRVEARLRKFDEAEAHVRLSIENFSRLGNRRNFAVAQITLGQLLLVRHNDLTGATERIRQSLAIAGELGDRFTQQQAAESLVRIHQLQVKRSKPGTVERRQAIDEIAYTLERLKRLALTPSLETLETLLIEAET